MSGAFSWISSSREDIQLPSNISPPVISGVNSDGVFVNQSTLSFCNGILTSEVKSFIIEPQYINFGG